MNKEAFVDKLYILGAVSPYPTEEENCPGYLIKSNNKKILLDCGFGICKKLNLPQDYENLHIFISHFHKDHYSDIYALAYSSYVHRRIGILNEKIKVYIPKLEPEDEEYESYLEFKKFKTNYFEIIEYGAFTEILLDNIKIDFLENHHPTTTFSIRVKLDGYTIVYAADTGYKIKNKLIDFSKNANLLLIESSFIKQDAAESEFHLHAYESAEIAKLANVEMLLLTHFWPGHDKKLYIEEAKEIFNNVEATYTNKVINLEKKFKI